MAHVALRLRREANWRDRLFLFVIGLLRPRHFSSRSERLCKACDAGDATTAGEAGLRAVICKRDSAV